jgi:hypothetical protein
MKAKKITTNKCAVRIATIGSTELAMTICIASFFHSPTCQ